MKIVDACRRTSGGERIGLVPVRVAGRAPQIARGRVFGAAAGAGSHVARAARAAEAGFPAGAPCEGETGAFATGM